MAEYLSDDYRKLAYFVYFNHLCRRKNSLLLCNNTYKCFMLCILSSSRIQESRAIFYSPPRRPKFCKFFSMFPPFTVFNMYYLYHPGQASSVLQ